MRDPHENVVQGRTQWRRFAALMVPAAAVAGAIVIGMANGALAASFAVSGQSFKVSAKELHGKGFVQYGGMAEGVAGENGVKKREPVAVSGIRDATLHELCQSVKVPHLPVVMTINAGDDPSNPVKATNLLLDVTRLEGDAEFKNIQIGRDASELGGRAEPGSFGQSSDEVTIKNLKQVAWSTSAATFTLNGLKLKVNVGKDAKECFYFADEAK